MNCRKNVSRMLPAEKIAYVNAVLALKAEAITQAALPQAWAAGARNRYDVYVWIHMMVGFGAHRGAAFAPWHREFLRQFELDLQRVSGNPKLTIPYWDWITARTPADAGWPFTNDLMGGMGTGADNRVETGKFAESAGLWTINVEPSEADYLRRNTGQNPADLPDIAESTLCLSRVDFDANPFATTAFPTSAQIQASFRKCLEFVLHNGPHGWVGGNMMPMTSPNDPVFFLHHCNVDRYWAVWQQKNAGGLTNYQPVSGTANHSLNSVMQMLDQAFYNFPVLATPAQLLDHKSLGFMYDTDLPILSLATPSVVFGEVPENTNTYLPVQFNIETCRKIKFRITAIGGNAAFQVPDFTTPYEAIVQPSEGEPQVGEVFVKLNATTGLGVISGMATIEAFVEDNQAYYAPSPGDFRVGTWNVNFSADIQARPKSAICLVLDKSGSMGALDGTSISRFEMLENAVAAARDILRDDDGVGMVYYDTDQNRLFDITQLAGGGRTNISNALANPALIPDGNTAIGKGMIAGADMLGDEISRAGTPYSNFAMLVLTDGNENVSPYVSSPAVNAAITGLTDDIYAVGLGNQGSVSDAVLGSISKYMLITGGMQADERLFRLTKYFVQILADITKNDIVVDPDGRLVMGMKQEVGYALNEADIYADVIVLSPFAPLMSVSLVAPNGDTIKGSSGNIIQRINVGNQLYRLSLPALPGKEVGSHAGDWKVVLELSPDEIKKNWQRLAEQNRELFSRLREYQSIPYSVIVQTYSNLNFKVAVEKNSNVAGAEIRLYATLKQYNLPIEGHVVAEVTYPSGQAEIIKLKAEDKGVFWAKFDSTVSGIYHVKFNASGWSLSHKRFTRETIRTVSLYRSEPIIPTYNGGNEGGNDRVCKMIDCLLEQESVTAYLKEHKIDVDQIRKCLKISCMDTREKTQKSTKEVTMRLSETELRLLNRLQPLVMDSSNADLIATAPEMQKVDFVSPQIPKVDKENQILAIDRGFKLNDKGELIIIDFGAKQKAEEKRNLKKKK